MTSDTPVAIHGASGEFGPLRRRGWRQLRAHHMREIDARLFEDRAVAQHAAFAAAAFRAMPSIARELRRAVCLLERRADAILQFAQVGEHAQSALRG